MGSGNVGNGFDSEPARTAPAVEGRCSAATAIELGSAADPETRDGVYWEVSGERHRSVERQGDDSHCRLKTNWTTRRRVAQFSESQPVALIGRRQFMAGTVLDWQIVKPTVTCPLAVMSSEAVPNHVKPRAAQVRLFANNTNPPLRNTRNLPYGR